MLKNPYASAGLIVGLVCGIGCSMPESGGIETSPTADSGQFETEIESPAESPAVMDQVLAVPSDANTAAKTLLDGLGPDTKYTVRPDKGITDIVIRDGSLLTPEGIELIGQLTGLERLQIHNYRALDDPVAAQLAGLNSLQELALTNSVISDATVNRIVQSFPDLTNLDLSYNANITNSALKTICELEKLERLTLIQNRFSDLGTSHLTKLKGLRVLDIRGNMEIGDLTMEILGTMPKLAALKHRSTTVTDFGLEYLAQSKTLYALLMQDFAVTDQAGQSLAQLQKLTQLEIFRCQGFGAQGLQALNGMKLNRLKLRDLPRIDDTGLAVFQDLPELKRLELHEMNSVSDAGLKNLAYLQSLEILDIWSIPQMTDATIDVIATLPNLKQLSVRATGITDAAMKRLLAMQKLQSLTIKENGSVTLEGLKILSGKNWAKLDVGN